MKKNSEIVRKLHSEYVADDYIQVMLAYRDYLILFGNNDLMYFKNLIKKTSSTNENSVNVYLEDERRNVFPYSQISEHVERVSLFKKLNFVNQILDFEKPYIRINDGIISKMTAFKDGDEALIHTEILNGKLTNKRSKIITREELEKYLKTGSLGSLDENEYEYTKIFDMSGDVYSPTIRLEHQWINEEKERLSKLIDRENHYSENTKINLKRAISSLDEVSPFVLIKKIMIKFKPNGEIKIDVFVVNYLERGKYIITLANSPVTLENLSMIRSKVKLPIVKLREPKIRLSLNPNITKKQLKEEKAKLLGGKRSI